MTQQQHQCDVCNKPFDTERGMHLHKTMVHADEPELRLLEQEYGDGIFEATGTPKAEREARAIEILERLHTMRLWDEIDMTYHPYWWGSIPAVGYDGQHADLTYAERLIHAALNDLVGMTAGKRGGILLREQARDAFLDVLDYGDEPEPKHRGDSVPVEVIISLTLEYHDTDGQDDAYDVLRPIAEEKQYRDDAGLRTPRAEVEGDADADAEATDR